MKNDDKLRNKEWQGSTGVSDDLMELSIQQQTIQDGQQQWQKTNIHPSSYPYQGAPWTGRQQG